MLGFIAFVINITFYIWPAEIYNLPYLARTNEFDDDRKRFFCWIMFLSSLMMLLNMLGMSSKPWNRYIYDISVIIMYVTIFKYLSPKVLFSFVLFLVVFSILYHNNEVYITLYKDAFTVTAWQTLKKIDRTLVYTFEKDHSCCGFNNVFDHCEEQYRLEIIYETVERNAMDHFMDVIDDFNDYSSSSSDYSISDRGLDVDYYDDNSSYPFYEEPLAETVKNPSLCDQLFAIEDPPYFHMPCRHDLRFPDGPPRNVSQVCPKPSFHEERICHLVGCKDHYFQVINKYLTTITYVVLGCMIIYFILVSQVIWRRLFKERLSYNSYSQGQQSQSNSCCC